MGARICRDERTLTQGWGVTVRRHLGRPIDEQTAAVPERHGHLDQRRDAPFEARLSVLAHDFDRQPGHVRPLRDRRHAQPFSSAAAVIACEAARRLSAVCTSPYETRSVSGRAALVPLPTCPQPDARVTPSIKDTTPKARRSLMTDTLPLTHRSCVPIGRISVPGGSPSRTHSSDAISAELPMIGRSGEGAVPSPRDQRGRRPTRLLCPPCRTASRMARCRRSR